MKLTLEQKALVAEIRGWIGAALPEMLDPAAPVTFSVADVAGLLDLSNGSTRAKLAKLAEFGALRSVTRVGPNGRAIDAYTTPEEFERAEQAFRERANALALERARGSLADLHSAAAARVEAMQQTLLKVTELLAAGTLPDAATLDDFAHGAGAVAQRTLDALYTRMFDQTQV